MANRIAEAIATLSPKAATDQDQVTDAKHLLHAIAAPPTPPARAHLPATPHHSPLHRRAAGQRPPPAPHRPRGQPRDGLGRRGRPALRVHQVVRPAHRRAGHPRADRPRRQGPRHHHHLPRRDRSAGARPARRAGRRDQGLATRRGPPACTPRRGCSAATTAPPPRTSARRTCRRPRWSTAWSGTSASRTWSSRTSSTRSTATFDGLLERPGVRGVRPGPGTPNGCGSALSGERRDRRRRPRSRTWTCARTRYQAEILADLDAERLVHGRWRNLVVMATGTGKTVVAALDYRRLHKAGRATRCSSSLTRSRSCGRACRRSGRCMRDGSFGETLVGGREAERLEARLRLHPVAAPPARSTPRRSTW